MDQQDSDEWHVRILHAVEDIARACTWMGPMIVAMLLVIALRVDCWSPKQADCKDDCAARSAAQEHGCAARFTRDSQCWCFDEKTGESTRLW